MKLKPLFVAASLATGVVPPVHADVNIVQNGSFQNYGADWIVTPAASGSDIYFWNFAAFGASGSLNDTVSQFLSTTPGQTYQLTFTESVGGAGGPSDLSASFGNNTVIDFANSNPSGFTTYTFLVKATSPSTLLSFAGSNLNDYDYVTNVSVTAYHISPVPEPKSYALMGLGLLGLMVLRQKRSKADQ
jgi:hypothetical protein